jgi:ABC-type lipoprotein release transport system permease subunit
VYELTVTREGFAPLRLRSVVLHVGEDRTLRLQMAVGTVSEEVTVEDVSGYPRRGQVLGLVLREGMSLAAAGTAAGLLGALALSRLLSSVLFGISATDPLTLAAMSALLVLVALAACVLPARRATRVDPAVCLRVD